MSQIENFAINGRFLTQAVTGVQRYARNVIDELNNVLREAGSSLPIIAPRRVSDPQLTQMPLVSAGRLSGHAWEQLLLPTLWTGNLLNLCNTAPAIKSKQIVCIHDANVFTKPESYGRGFKVYYRTLQPLIVRRSIAISSVSKYSAVQLSKFLPIEASKIVILPNGHEHALSWSPVLAKLSPAILADRPGGASRPFVMTIGSQAAHKNMELVINIAPALAEKNIDVLIVGGTANIFSASGLAGGSNVIFTGRINDNELAFLMDRALCLLFPSWTEGFGLPIVEAMARGCPVVSSDRASMPEICSDAALMARPDDPTMWIKHIKDLLAYRSLRDEMIERGRERVKQFSWKKTAEAYVSLMQCPG